MSDRPAQPIRAFLDANVLLSAALRPEGGASKLWSLANVTLVTCEQAADEAWDNLDSKRVRTRGDPVAARARLAVLMQSVEFVPADSDRESSLIFCGWKLRDPKDMPILLDAINSSCQYLLTSDSNHFGEFFGQTTCGLTVMPPGAFLHHLGFPATKPDSKPPGAE